MQSEILSRQDALKQKSKFYFTGKPCKHGHVEKRSTITSGCYKCMNKNNDIARKKRRAILRKEV